MDADGFRERIANRLKSLRSTHGLSLDAAAARTGVSKAMLGQIERRESSPTIATLWKIASGLGASFSSFLAGYASEGEEAGGRTAEGPAPDRAFPDDPDMRVRVLIPFHPDTRLEIFEVTLTNHHRQRSVPHRPGVIEHVAVTRGEMEVLFDGNWHRLREGEACRFRADREHGYRGLTDTAAFTNIISYP